MSLAEALSQTGCQVDIVCSKKNSLANLSFIDRITFQKNKYDILHTHAGFGYELLYLREKNWRKWVHTYHGTQIGNLLASAPLRVFNPKYLNVAYKEIQFGRHADSLIAVSELCKTDLERIYRFAKKRIEVISSGHFPIRMLSNSERNQERARLGIPGSAVVLIFVGRDGDPAKGGSCLLKAFDLIRREFSDVFLLMIPGNTVPVGAPGIKALGRHFYRNLSTFYAIADIAIGCSAYEGGHSLALLEAMAAGLPIIATNIPSSREFLNQSCCYFVNPKDPGSLFQAISDLVIDKNRRDKLGACGLLESTKYEWPAIARTTLDLYGNVLKQNS